MSTEAKRSKAIPPSQQTNYSFGVAAFRVFYSKLFLAIAFFLYLNYHQHLGLQIPKSNSSDIEKLVYTLKLQLFSIFTLALSMFHVMSFRISNINLRNPLSGHEFYVEKANRILLNTVEQLPLYLVNIFVFAIVSGSAFFWVPFLVACFTIGRITFLIGYTIHPQHRVFGFVWTFVPVMLVFIYNLCKVFGM